MKTDIKTTKPIPLDPLGQHEAQNIEGMLCAARTDSWVDKNGKKLISRRRGKWKKTKHQHLKRLADEILREELKP